MELNQLNYFRVVARLENMTKAAEELYISQPNLSTSISRLENNLGIQLFQRTRGHIYLTEAGRKFLEHVEVIFDELESAEFQLQEEQEYEMDSIAVGSGAFSIIPALFARCYQDYGLIPSTQMLLSNGEVEQNVRDGLLDIGIVTSRPKLQELEYECVGESPLVAVVKNTNPIGGIETVGIYHFRHAHFICNTLYFDRDQLNDLCLKSGFQPQITRISNEQEFFDERSFDFGDNVTICPLYIVPYLIQVENMELQFIRLGDSHAQQKIYLLHHKKNIRTAFVPEFFNYARDVVREHIAQQNAAGDGILAQTHCDLLEGQQPD